MTDVNLFFASVNIGCADPGAQAHFWGKVLGREVTAGLTGGTMTVGTTDPGGRPQMVFHPAPEAERIVGGFVPTLVTEQHDEETERLTGVGAKVLDQLTLGPIRLSVFADPEGNRFQLATFVGE
ncbi:VOC family protein [Catenulispora pinisilvae]|uniref:VOC family protein n=1 Tax=Catenulispora pinisilvae TaxID=2705253 RepID=UPI0018914192|nr:VOC family protein [Catenulispora pinisilvae]